MYAIDTRLSQECLDSWMAQNIILRRPLDELDLWSQFQGI